MNKHTLNTILSYAGIVLLFLVISYAFVPEVLGGKIVNQSDIAGWTGMTQEIVEYNQAHPDDKALWTNSMFGGMPTVSIHADFKGDWTKTVYDFLLTGARPATYLFISLIGGFLLMLAFGLSPLLAVGGAIAITFCSYNMQIIQVGHNTKMQAIAYMPWVLAALVYTYRSATEGLCKRQWLPKVLAGAVLFAFALSFQIKANHPQISYYLAILVFIYAIALFISVLRSPDRNKKLAGFFCASALLLVIGGIGIATNLNKLLPTYEYAQYSMRGGSELKPQTESHNSDGLDLDYATAWSYGISETPNLLIPNFNGGSSSGDPKLRNSETRDLLRQARQPNIDEIMQSLPLYWGPQPFTAGPMYMGAVSIFLFVFGLIMLKGKEKWWLLAATVIAVLLAWGSHCMWFTKLWFEHVPMYDKFRTVSMALVILQMTIPVLGFLALDRICKDGVDRKATVRTAWIAYGLSGGFCLLFAIFPDLAGSFRGSADAGMQEILADALAADRRAMLVKDAVRSLVMISCAFALVMWSLKATGQSVQKKRMTILAAAMAVLVLADLWGIDKRYLNKSHFVTRSDFSSQFRARPVDEIILEDPALDYRVLDISVNTFNDSHTSYWHKSIGGYSPAKLQRYQDLIERHLTGEINSVIRAANNSATITELSENLPELPVVSMLNGKYIILGGDFPPVENRNAMGNCWFVSDAVTAPEPDDEIDLLGSTELSSTAIIGRDFSWAADRIAAADTSGMSNDRIELTGYAPHRLKYSCSLSSERAVIFSEIFYPEGWKAWVEPSGKCGEIRGGNYVPTSEAKEIELFRADWILRGALLPAGEYEFVMEFDPQVYKTGEAISRASSISLFILLIMAGVFGFRRKRD